MRLTVAAMRIIDELACEDELAREKTTYPHVDRIGARLRSRLYGLVYS
jgi:hypothetical protein